MRRLRSLLLTSSIAAFALVAPQGEAFAQGKSSQPPTPSATGTAKPSGTSSAPTPGTTGPKSGTATGTATGTGTGTGTGTATGTG
ncbi:MAG: hypothetical protein L6Q76_26090, partial [Polyangiaceae bacterium]|nr:hypothetical protein [Polyangiaceae bacterium]